jgi:hypothetical protein
MILKNNNYIVNLINYSFNDQILPIYKGGGGGHINNGFFPKNQILSNLKLIYFQINI